MPEKTDVNSTVIATMPQKLDVVPLPRLLKDRPEAEAQSEQEQQGLARTTTR